MRRKSCGVAAQMLRALEGGHIEPRYITTGEIRISVLVPREEEGAAVRLIHESFFPLLFFGIFSRHLLFTGGKMCYITKIERFPPGMAGALKNGTHRSGNGVLKYGKME